MPDALQFLVLTLAGLRRYLVLSVIELKTRPVKISGVHRQPHGGWMEQMVRHLIDTVDGFLRRTRHLIHDRDPLYTRAFDEILKSSGVQPIRLPSSITIVKETTRDSTIGCWNGHHHQRTRTPRFAGVNASADY